MSVIKNKYDHLSKPKADRPKKEGYEVYPTKEIVISYLGLRRFIGFSGILLPLILIFGSFILGSNLLPSISDYYHSSLRTFFTGINFIIAIFLWHHMGDRLLDNFLSKAASISIFCVTLFPTPVLPEYLILENHDYQRDFFECLVTPSLEQPNFVGDLHYFFAACFFLCLIILVLFSFIRAERMSDNDSRRIILYKVCGFGMLISILLVAILSKKQLLWDFPPTFLFETIALILFGSSWLVKGEVERISLKKP